MPPFHFFCPLFECGWTLFLITPLLNAVFKYFLLFFSSFCAFSFSPFSSLHINNHKVSYVPSSLGVMLIHVSIQVTPISASPFRVMVVEATCDDKADAAASVDGTKAKSVSKDVGSEEVEALSTTSDERCQELATGSKQQSPLAPPVDGS